MRLVRLGPLLILVMAASAGAQGVHDVTILGDEVRARVAVSGYEADLTLQFENVTGLTAANLGLSAEAVDPNDPILLARLPPGAVIPPEFPVLIRVEPPPGSTLSLTGVASMEIYTHDLSYSSDTTLRVFSATGSGPFENATTDLTGGSVRTSDMQPDFPDTSMYVRDSLGLQSTVDDQLVKLQSTFALNLPEIDPDVAQMLSATLSTLSGALDSQAWVEAIKQTEIFAAQVIEHSGATIPDTWRAGDPTTNVAGQLRMRAARLRFNLLRAANGFD